MPIYIFSRATISYHYKLLLSAFLVHNSWEEHIPQQIIVWFYFDDSNLFIGLKLCTLHKEKRETECARKDLIILCY